MPTTTSFAEMKDLDSDVEDVAGSGSVESGDTVGRVLDAALELVGRWGVAKTALADVAKTAGCSRATLYRAFPGGKQQMFSALGAREVASFLQAVGDVIDSADDLEDAVTRSLVVAARLLRDHDAVLFVMEHEPELLVPYLGFKQVDGVYAYVSASLAPHLERFVEVDRAKWLAEWSTRLFISYVFKPDPLVDLSSIDRARQVVSSFVIPAFQPSGR